MALKNTTTVFKELAQDRYNKLTGLIGGGEVVNAGINRSFTKDELEKAINIIVKNLWKWESISLEPNPEKDYTPINLTFADARQVLGPFTRNSKDSDVAAFLVEYKFKYNGDLKALNYRVKLGQRDLSFEAEVGSSLTYFHYVQGTDIEPLKAEIKQRKDYFLNVIKQNQDELDNFIESKAISFRNMVSYHVNKAFDDDNDKGKHLEDL